MVERENSWIPAPPPLPLSSAGRQKGAQKLEDCVVHNLKIISERKAEEVTPKQEATRYLVQQLIDSRCGLVALCMASHLLPCKPIDVQHAMCSAQELGFTLQGEMFSAMDMADLARHLCRCPAEVVRGEPRRHSVITALLNLDLVLIPYDRDHNNEPCCRKGHKAHWAALTGILLSSEQKQIAECRCYRQDSELPQLFHARLKAGSKTETTHCHGEDCKKSLTTQVLSNLVRQIHVYAKQGKSLHSHLWKLDSLLDSNDNLTELDPKIEKCRDDYLIPHLGIKYGLCGQIVILRTSQTWNLGKQE